MPRLAIVIPACGQASALESTLVCVLENRPADVEVLVSHAGPYADPYQLSGEVRFVPCPKRESLAGCVMAALPHVTAPWLQVLPAGSQVHDGWTVPVRKHLKRDEIVAIAPVVAAIEPPHTVLSAGLSYARGGKRIAHQTPPNGETAAQVDAAPLWGGYYRASALREAGGLSSQVGDQLADVDLALRLAHAGGKTLLESAAHVFVPQASQSAGANFLSGLHEERLFWRNAPLASWPAGLAAHAARVLFEAATALVRPRKLLSLSGRAAALCQLGGIRQHYALLDQIRRGPTILSSDRGDMQRLLAMDLHDQSAGQRRAKAG